MTVETIALTEQEARRLTERIRTRLDRVSTAWADLATSITEAYQRRADLALGYGSWAEYAEAELKPSEGLAADVRRQLVGMLSAQGMSVRAIAPTVGVTKSQAARDVSHVGTPEPERINPATGEVVPGPTYRPTDVTDWTPQEVDDLIDADERELEAWKASTVPAPPKVVGLDGKTYTRPEKPSETAARVAATSAEKRDTRRPLPDAFWESAYDLTKKAEALLRMTTDDRFPRNREAIAAKNLHALQQTANTLARVLAAIES